MKVAPSPGVVRLFGAPLMTALAATWRMSGPGSEPWRDLRAQGKPFVFLLWHEVLLPLLWWHRQEDIAIVVSRAREGRYLGDYAEQLGYHALLGSSSQGGFTALLGARRSLDRGQPVAFTPDGPRGPRREMKPGIVRLAQRTGATVVPLHAKVNTSWRLHSWDRLIVPRPFARVDIRCGVPFSILPGEGGFEDGMHRCAEALDALDAPA